MESDSDEQLLRRSATGDPQQFAVLWDRHRDRVYRHLVAATRDPFLAEDLTASAFLELWRRRGSVRFMDGSALPWLLATASNVARNRQRALRRYQAFLSRLPPAPPPAPHDADTAVDDERMNAVREVMHTASAPDRDLLLLTAVEGFTIREAAQVVGVSESAAKMRLHRLRARIVKRVDRFSVAEG